MTIDRDTVRNFLATDLTDFFVRLGLLVLAIIACERIFAPFLPIMLWALVLAICFYPACRALGARLGWSDGRSATVIVLLLLLLIGTPTVMLGSSFASHIFATADELRSGEYEPPEMPDSVRKIPVVGERIYEDYAEAIEDLPATLEALEPQLSELTKQALASAASTAGTLLFFLGATIVAGIMMAYGEDGGRAMERVAVRLAGSERGPYLHRLATLTVRSVANGVVGVAVIQALLLGVGFLFAGIPAAGLLALIVLVLGILQLPALLITLPVLAYIWGMGDGGTVVNTILTVYLLVAGGADGILKPMLLGRGVDVPMPIVLIGALGGMVSAGIVGLFVGAVVLSVGYELFMGWLSREEGGGEASPDAGPDPVAAED